METDALVAEPVVVLYHGISLALINREELSSRNDVEKR
jgi:hypothetical protein